MSMRYKQSGWVHELRGKMALIQYVDASFREVDPYVLAQFDYDADKQPAPEGTVLHKFQHGWHALPIREFENPW